MNKRILLLCAAVCLLCTGCASLLERSYSVVEPYTDRYWDSEAEDTLKAENYQDLVNSLLMLIEQRSEEGVIRYYAPEGEDSYVQAVQAKREVQNDTVLGSYLLDGMSVMFTSNDGYCTLTYFMSYREDTQDVSTLMALSDSQSLVDLLRLAVREEHSSITAQFISKTSRDEVLNVVESLWQELYRDQLEQSGALPPAIQPTPAEGETPTDGEEQTEETPPSDEAPPPPADGSADDGETPAEPPSDDTTPPEGEGGETTEPPSSEDLPKGSQSAQIYYPPCPWDIRFYPDTDFPEIVEIILK